MSMLEQTDVRRSMRDGARLRMRPEERLLVACWAAVFTVAGIVFVHPPSLAHFAYYLFLWSAFILLFHKEEIRDFVFAFLVNSAFVALFFTIQATVYPDSYGTTSPLGSWTDDSHFFSLVADNIPPNLPLRDGYYLYFHTFTTFIRSVTLLSIDHPMDVIFFQSGIAAALATFSKRLMFQLSSDRRLSDTVFAFVLVCPVLMMNGGVIFIRDTLTAALLVYSLCCLNAHRFVLAAAAVAFHLMLRPGTALILFPAYAIIFFPETKAFVRRHVGMVAAAAVLLAVVIARLIQAPPDLLNMAAGTSEGGGISFLGREILDGLTADPDANVVFLSVQELPFAIKFFLNAAYIFLYPFFGPKQAFAGDFFDVRAITMNLIAPIYALWLNAWFIAGAVSKVRVTRKQTLIVAAVLVTFLMIGTYSLQTRHKLIIYPLYYFVIAIGFAKASPRERQIGYLCSSFLLLLQMAFAFR